MNQRECGTLTLRKWRNGRCERRLTSRVEVVDPPARERFLFGHARAEVMDPSSAIGKLVKGNDVFVAVDVGVAEHRR